jgi:hypothetical protein
MFTLNNNRNSKFQIAFTVVVSAIAILTLGMAKFSTASVADRSYDAVEQIRGGRSLVPLSAIASYDAVEHLRVERTFSPVASGYDLLEQLRISRGLSADRSYDNVEQARLFQTFSVSSTGYDLIEQLRLARGIPDAYATIETLRLGR